MKWMLTLTTIVILLTACSTPLTQPVTAPLPADTPQASVASFALEK